MRKKNKPCKIDATSPALPRPPAAVTHVPLAQLALRATAQSAAAPPRSGPAGGPRQQPETRNAKSLACGWWRFTRASILGDSLGPVMFFSTWQDLEVMLAPSLSLSIINIRIVGSLAGRSPSQLVCHKLCIFLHPTASKMTGIRVQTPNSDSVQKLFQPFCK